MAKIYRVYSIIERHRPARERQPLATAKQSRVIARGRRVGGPVFTSV